MNMDFYENSSVLTLDLIYGQVYNSLSDYATCTAIKASVF